MNAAVSADSIDCSEPNPAVTANRRFRLVKCFPHTFESRQFSWQSEKLAMVNIAFIMGYICFDLLVKWAKTYCCQGKDDKLSAHQLELSGQAQLCIDQNHTDGPAQLIRCHSENCVRCKPFNIGEKCSNQNLNSLTWPFLINNIDSIFVQQRTNFIANQPSMLMPDIYSCHDVHGGIRYGVQPELGLQAGGDAGEREIQDWAGGDSVWPNKEHHQSRLRELLQLEVWVILYLSKNLSLVF